MARSEDRPSHLAVEVPPLIPAIWLNISVLASAPLYTSGTFWAVAGVIVGIASVAAILATWQKGAPRRLLLYSLPVATSLLSQHLGGRADSDLRLTYRGRELINPYAATLRLESKGRRDIRSADFDQNKPLVFDLGVPIVAVVGGSETFAIPAETISIDGNSVKVAPTLIRPGVALRLSLLTEGQPHITPRSPLIDIALREQEPGVRRSIQLVVFGAIIGLIISGIGSVVTAPNRFEAAAVASVAGIVLTIGVRGLFNMLRGNLKRRNL
jgi:hypothetical protein